MAYLTRNENGYEVFLNGKRVAFQTLSKATRCMKILGYTLVHII